MQQMRFGHWIQLHYVGVFFVKTHFSLDFLQQKILFTNSGENPMWFYFGSSKNFACQNMYITHTLLTSYLIPFGRVNNYLSDEGSSTCPFCPLQYYCPVHRVLIRVSLWAGIWDHRSQRQEENLQEAISTKQNYCRKVLQLRVNRDLPPWKGPSSLKLASSEMYAVEITTYMLRAHTAQYELVRSTLIPDSRAG